MLLVRHDPLFIAHGFISHVMRIVYQTAAPCDAANYMGAIIEHAERVTKYDPLLFLTKP